MGLAPMRSVGRGGGGNFILLLGFKVKIRVENKVIVRLCTLKAIGHFGLRV